jgi:hypothetical protein
MSTGERVQLGAKGFVSCHTLLAAYEVDIYSDLHHFLSQSSMITVSELVGYTNTTGSLNDAERRRVMHREQ